MSEQGFERALELMEAGKALVVQQIAEWGQVNYDVKVQFGTVTAMMLSIEEAIVARTRKMYRAELEEARVKSEPAVARQQGPA